MDENTTLSVSQGYENNTRENQLSLSFLLYDMTLSLVLILVGIVGNSLTLTSICKFKELRKNKHILVGSLAVADLLISIGMAVARIDFLVLPKGNCMPRIVKFIMQDVVIRFPVYSANLNILFIALDKFVAIVFPLRYPALVTRKTLVSMVAIAWVAGLFLSVIALFFAPGFPLLECGYLIVSSQVNAVLILTEFCLVFLALSGIYLKILRESNAQLKKIQTVIQLHGTSNDPDGSRGTRPSASEVPTPFRLTKAERGILMILLASLLLNSPYFLYCILMLTDSPILRTYSGMHLFYLAIEFVMLNSCLNIFIYVIYYRDFRIAHKKLLCCTKTGEFAE